MLKVDLADKIVEKYHADPRALIQILLDIQREYNWLPKEVLLSLSNRLDVPLERIYQVATFYKAFSLVPRGRHTVKVCTGTACHVRGAPSLQEKTSEILGVDPGGTTPDYRFSMDTVNCLGCCALGPVIVIDEEYHSNPSTADLEKLIDTCS